jgi:mono/diheme cytochrome c family protein
LDGNLAAGKKFFNENCADCHGEKGDGQGPRAYFINPRPASFISDKSLATLNRPTLYTHIFAGKLGTEMPAWRHVLSDQEIGNVAEYVFRAFIEPNQPKVAKASASK